MNLFLYGRSVGHQRNGKTLIALDGVDFCGGDGKIEHGVASYEQALDLAKRWEDTGNAAFWHAPSKRFIQKPKNNGARWFKGDGTLFMWADGPLFNDGVADNADGGCRQDRTTIWKGGTGWDDSAGAKRRPAVYKRGGPSGSLKIERKTANVSFYECLVIKNESSTKTSIDDDGQEGGLPMVLTERGSFNQCVFNKSRRIWDLDVKTVQGIEVSGETAKFLLTDATSGGGRFGTKK